MTSLSTMPTAVSNASDTGIPDLTSSPKTRLYLCIVERKIALLIK